jgi:hypothetical protein
MINDEISLYGLDRSMTTMLRYRFDVFLYTEP